MSAVVCGSKRSFFDDLSSTSPPVTKRHRCSSSSPIRFSPPPPPTPSILDHLSALFPDTDSQLLERALDECGNDLESAIVSLNRHPIGSVQEKQLGPAEVSDANKEEGLLLSGDGGGGGGASENLSAPSNLPANGVEWVELLVREMTSATSMDDARARAASVLESLENSISTVAAAEAAQNFHKENMMLKEQIEALIRDNTILKRAVAIQHERQKEYDDRNQELQYLKQLLSQYQEQLRKLEVNNYALTMHLKQAQQSSSIPGRFHPDVF